MNIDGAGAFSRDGYLVLRMIRSALDFYIGGVSYRIASKTTHVKSDEGQRGSLIREGEVHFAFAIAKGKYVQSVIECDDYDGLSHIDGPSDEIGRICFSE
jgi:hypothetical protein